MTRLEDLLQLVLDQIGADGASEILFGPDFESARAGTATAAVARAATGMAFEEQGLRARATLDYNSRI